MNNVSRIKILFFFQKKTFLPDRKRLKQYLAELFTRAGKTTGEIIIVFCSDEELLKINQSYLKHDYYTDIITFPLTAPASFRIEAELYISVDRIRDNAIKNSVSLQRELHRVIFHGCLHLIGLKDKTVKEQSTMREKEEILLNEYFVSRGT